MQGLPGTVQHGAQAVGNEQYCALRKPAPQGGLHLALCPWVHSSRGLVQNEDLGFPEKGTCQTQELLLAHTGKEWDSQARCLHVGTDPQGVPTNVPTPYGSHRSEGGVSLLGGPLSIGILILPFLSRATLGKSYKASVPQSPHLWDGYFYLYSMVFTVCWWILTHGDHKGGCYVTESFLTRL